MFQPRHSAPYHILAAALAPPHWSLRRLRWPNPTFGKLPLGTLHIWEVTTWEILTWEVALGKMPLGKYLKLWQMTLHLYSSMSDWKWNLVTRINSNFPELNFQLKDEGYLCNPWSDKGLKDTVVNGHFTMFNEHWDQDINYLGSLDFKVSHSPRLLGLSLAIISQFLLKTTIYRKRIFEYSKCTWQSTKYALVHTLINIWLN